MRLADNLARLGNINAARGALDRSVLGLEMLSNCRKAECVPMTRRNLMVLITLHEVIEGRDNGTQNRDRDWDERASRYGVYLGIREASRSEEQIAEWRERIEGAYQVALEAMEDLDEDRTPSLIDSAEDRIRQSLDSIRSVYSQVVRNTATESSELEMLLHGT